MKLAEYASGVEYFIQQIKLKEVLDVQVYLNPTPKQAKEYLLCYEIFKDLDIKNMGDKQVLTFYFEIMKQYEIFTNQYSKKCFYCFELKDGEVFKIQAELESHAKVEMMNKLIENGYLKITAKMM